MLYYAMGPDHLPCEQHGVKRARVPPIPNSAEVERKKQEKENRRIDEYTALLAKLYEAVR